MTTDRRLTANRRLFGLRWFAPALGSGGLPPGLDFERGTESPKSARIHSAGNAPPRRQAGLTENGGKPPHSKAASPPVLVALTFLAAPSPAPATQVDWNGLPFSTNLTSTGQPWDDTWVAELGSFNGSFTPTSSNTATWAASWRAASRSSYRPATGYFAGSFSYDTNSAPFLAGVRAYLWLFNPHAPQGEWILLTNPAWAWPAGSPFDPITTTWASSDATLAVVGQRAAPGWSLKSTNVLNSPLPFLTFADWQALYFTPTEISDWTISGLYADPDNDGSPNYNEFAAGTLPRRATSFPPPVEVFLHLENGQLYGAAKFYRSTRLRGITWQAQAADALSGSGWNSNTITIAEFPWEWTVRRSESTGVSPRGFLRFRIHPSL